MKGLAWKSWPLPPAGTDLRDWQDGRCAMCGHSDQRLVRDHCHTTGFIRGLLCSGCNTSEDYYDADWKQWREGDTPARALGVVEVYVGVHGTPIANDSPLQHYSRAETEAWWASCIESGELPTEVPWTDSALASKAIYDAEVREALNRAGDWLASFGFGSRAS